MKISTNGQITIPPDLRPKTPSGLSGQPKRWQNNLVRGI